MRRPKSRQEGEKGEKEEKEEESSTEEEEEKESPKPAFLRETLSGRSGTVDYDSDGCNYGGD